MHVYQMYLLVLFLWLNPDWWKSHSKSHNYYTQTFSKNVCLCFLTGKMGILSIKETNIHYWKWVYKIHKSELRWMCLTILGLNINFQRKGLIIEKNWRGVLNCQWKLNYFMNRALHLALRCVTRKERTQF